MDSFVETSIQTIRDKVGDGKFMTAESAELPWEVLGKVTSRIVNEVKGVNRVLYD